MNPSDTLTEAQIKLLQPSNISYTDVEQILSASYTKSHDYADVYIQHAEQESWVLENGIIKDGGYSISRGGGIRSIKDDLTGFSYTDDISVTSLIRAANLARTTANNQANAKILLQKKDKVAPCYTTNSPLNSITNAEKLDLLQYIDTSARKKDARIKQVIASLVSSHEIIFIASTDGEFAADIRPMVRLYINVIAEQNGKKEQGSYGGGGRFTYEHLIERGSIDSYINEAVRQATLNLEAQEAPAGQLTVVLGSGWPGVLLHEAIGHGLEGDFIRKETSAFTGKIGERVADAAVTVVDNGTLENRRGSLTIDDEGLPTQCTTLIENGILTSYMYDKHNARLQGVSSTGNGRRQSYAHLPMPRMTNTYMLAGNYSPDEIIESVDHGFYAANFGGGQVDITSGKFVFTASEAYMIKHGKIAYPVKGATLIGNGPDVLTHVSMVGNDLNLDEGVGTCGKEGQNVPVCVGQPTIKIDNLTIGGTFELDA